MRKVAFLTDIEGRWEKLLEFCSGNALVRYDATHGLRVADDALFVFGGDAIDRGPAGRKILTTLLDAKRAQPDRVVLLAGNRDINKLRLARELDVTPPEGSTRGDLLRHIFAKTMGARDAFEHRSTELRLDGRAFDDEAVVESWLEDVTPRGLQTRYVEAAVLAHREEETLFLHGGVSAENLGVVPKVRDRITEVDTWIRALNEFYAESMSAFIASRSAADGTPGWQDLIAYQAPLPGTRFNETSVVYARPSDERGNPRLPPSAVIVALRRADIHRVVVGHTPSGDCPAVIRESKPSGFELVMADNSYGRIEGGSRLVIDRDLLRVEGTTQLDSGAREAVAFELSRRGDAGPLGLRDARTGRLVKARLARGDYLTFRGLADYRVEQIAASEAELPADRLEEPR